MENEERKSRVAWPPMSMVTSDIDKETQKDIHKLIDDFGIILEDEAQSRGISIFSFPLYKPFNLMAGVTETHVLIVISTTVGTTEQRWLDFQSKPNIPTIEQLKDQTTSCISGILCSDSRLTV